MLIFIQTLKPNFKTNKTSLSLVKRKLNQNKGKERKNQVFKKFSSKEKTKMTFQKCSKYHWELWDSRISKQNTLQVINSIWVKNQQNRCFKMLSTIKEQQKRAWWQRSRHQERQLLKSSDNNFEKARKLNGHKDVVLIGKQKDHQNKVFHKD